MYILCIFLNNSIDDLGKHTLLATLGQNKSVSIDINNYRYIYCDIQSNNNVCGYVSNIIPISLIKSGNLNRITLSFFASSQYAIHLQSTVTYTETNITITNTDYAVAGYANVKMRIIGIK